MGYLSNFIQTNLNDFGIEYDLLKKFEEEISKAEEKRINAIKEAYEEERKSFKWTFREYAKSDEFLLKYSNVETYPIYVLVNNESGEEIGLFRGGVDLKKQENELNSTRFVILHKYFEAKYNDSIMESCHGKNWRKGKDRYTGKPITPYHLISNDVIFDTETGEIIYEDYDTNSCHSLYIKIYDNVAKIYKSGEKTVFFNLPKREIILKTDLDMMETNNFLIIGNTKCYGGEIKSATVINKNTCNFKEID